MLPTSVFQFNIPARLHHSGGIAAAFPTFLPGLCARVLLLLSFGLLVVGNSVKAQHNTTNLKAK